MNATTSLRAAARRCLCTLLLLSAAAALFGPARAGAAEVDVSHGRALAMQSLEREVARLEGRWLEGIETLADWEKRREELRREIAEMLGLSPFPERTPLEVTVTGVLEHEEFTVRKLHFQSQPGLYVTANLYLPRNIQGKIPAVLYLCGHTRVIEGGLSYGPKTAGGYQSQPAWYARHGIASLILDTLHAGEIRGVHHGAHSEGRWWWYNRGYTPGGVETWNAIRALDLLESLPEVDPERLVVTGLSGGGGVSWYLNALEDRPRYVLPAAGIADLRSYVVDHTIQNHCDCMFYANRHRRDIPMMAALGAPRRVVLINNDGDHLFPLSGIYRTYEQVRRIYALYGKQDEWRMLIGHGGHSDAPLRPIYYRWLEDWLTGKVTAPYRPAEAFFDKEQLRVFSGTDFPAGEINTTIDETFIAAAPEPPVPATREAWAALRDGFKRDLAAKSFAGWPARPDEPSVQKTGELRAGEILLESYEFTSRDPIRLRFWMIRAAGSAPAGDLPLRVLDDEGWVRWIGALRAAAGERTDEIIGPGARSVAWPAADADAWRSLAGEVTGSGRGLVFFAPFGIGPTRWLAPDEPRDSIRRGFFVVGQTRDGMQVWDLRQAIAALRSLPVASRSRLRLQGSGAMAGIVLYAAIHESGLAGLDLHGPTETHRDGPIFLNVSKILDLPQALALAAEQTPVALHGARPEAWAWTQQLARTLDWKPEQLQFAPAGK